MRRRFAQSIILLLLMARGTVAAEPPVSHGPVPGQPYLHYSTTDAHQRDIDFYLSEPVADDARGPLPLVVYVHGSGATSHFTRRRGRLIPRNGHIGVFDVAKDRARVLIVEKPGVTLGDDPRTGAERAGSETFRREHTLELWADAVGAAIGAAHELPDIDGGRTVVIGHSEGGIVACRVGRVYGDRVSHVAILAGGGPTQLFSLVQLARRGEFFTRISDDPEQRVRHVLDSWAKIRADPESTDELFFGFAYRRWSSFLASSPADELRGADVEIYIAQGLDDPAVDPVTADMLYATLASRGQDVEYDRVANAGHSFEDTTGEDRPDGWRVQLRRVVDWALTPGE